MIKIDVKPYCDNCEDFVPDVKTFIGSCANKGTVCKLVNHTIRCVNRSRCASIENYIRNKGDYPPKDF